MKRALLALLLGGCSFVIDSSKYVGVGTPDGGMPADTGVPLDVPVTPMDVVTGTSIITVISSTESVPVPQDLSACLIDVLIPDENEPTGFQPVRHGTGRADGTFTVENVAAGTYYLKVLCQADTTTHYYVTSNHAVDLGDTRGGRSDAVDVSVTQPLQIELTGMQAWTSSDELILEEYNTASEEWDTNLFLMPQLARGATEIHSTHDWGCTNGYCYSHRPSGRPGLIDASKGDHLYVNHVAGSIVVDDGGRHQAVSRVVDVAEFGDIMMTSGVATPLDAPFRHVDPTITLNFPIDRSLFDANFTGNPSGFQALVSQIWAGPGEDRGILISPPIAEVNYTDWHGIHALRSTVTVSYGDPFPPAWPRVLYQNYDRVRYYQLPGASGRRGQIFSTVRLGPVPSLIPSAPPLAPPTAITIDGADAMVGGRVHFDREAPVRLAWSTDGHARYFSVQVMKVYADGTRTRLQGIAELRTADTTLDIPAEVFASNEYFVFIVAAVQDDGEYQRGELTHRYSPARAEMATGMFRLSATCGNGTMESGEFCDPGDTASATCDIDCTEVFCGDGLTNTAAGEVCDTVLDTALCNSDCTPVVCGDGRVNGTVEDCDDGNVSDDGNGCTYACRSSAQCGDGVVQDAVETCDDGNFTDDGNGCDVTCQAINNCGDGVLESALGPDGLPLETCDTAGVDTPTCDGPFCRAPSCGDEYWNSTAELCDEGGDTATCDSDCTPVTCGDGHVNASSEQCDDGNRVNSDGCASSCSIEPGFTCVGSPSVCAP